LMKTAGKKVAATFIDLKFGPGFTTSRAFVLPPTIICLVKGGVGS
jgi:hypothetical protein